MTEKIFRIESSSSVVVKQSKNDPARCWLPEAVQAVTGLLIPYLPEPRSSDSGKGARVDVHGKHLANITREFQRVLRLISSPNIRNIRPDEVSEDTNKPYFTFDLRICTGGAPQLGREATHNDLMSARFIVLIKATMEVLHSSHRDRCYEILCRELENVSDKFRSLMPNDLTVLPVRWSDSGPLVEIAGGPIAFVRPECVGLGPGYTHSVEIRRALVSALRFSNLDFDSYLKESLANKWSTIPISWPASTTDGLATCTAMLSSAVATVLSIRIQPTRLTEFEESGMREILTSLSNKRSREEKIAQRTLRGILDEREIFQCSVQVSSECDRIASVVADAFIAEQGFGFRQQAISQARHLSLIPTMTDQERELAEYNLRFIEMLPWGFVDDNSQNVNLPDGGMPELTFKTVDATSSQTSEVTISFGNSVPRQNSIRLPDNFLERDIGNCRRTARLRSLLTISEIVRLWRLPVVPPGGHLGIQSRYPNPFEQLPEPTPWNGDSVSLGVVQVKGLDTTTEFRVPFAPFDKQQRVPGVAGVGDRSIVVAGSPGSGKTNFCLAFLMQLWISETLKNDSRRGRNRNSPYLVIDPTRGNEFRALIDSPEQGSDDVMLFTVGDPRYSPFCFNPFHVPRKVSVQSHISRLMSCFRAAYEMWDPLPAIFEMALRLAYKGIRAKWWESQSRSLGRKWSAAIDFAESDNEPFPKLSDLLLAMGTGKPGEEFYGQKPILAEQKEMWGEGTENSHTIVASTYLRLRNLSENYDSIIGGEAQGRRCVDLRKLMQFPAILEFGMIGDSQALSLIMSFLVCALAGTIEGRELNESGEKKFHMLVLEEAHRLLAGDHGGGKQGANSKAQAAEDINTMLAEVRKYGQGVMIIDQRPGSLVGGVIDNAYLVAMHRLNEEKGFRQLIQQLNLNPDQQRYVRSELRPGQMVTLDRRSGMPVLLKPGNKNTDGTKATDDFVANLMNCSWEAVKSRFRNLPQEDSDNCHEILAFIDRLDEIENNAKREGLAPAQLLEKRKCLSIPILEELFEWIDAKLQVVQNSISKSALEYVRNNRASLFRFTATPDRDMGDSRISRILLKAEATSTVDSDKITSVVNSQINSVGSKVETKAPRHKLTRAVKDSLVGYLEQDKEGRKRQARDFVACCSRLPSSFSATGTRPSSKFYREVLEQLVSEGIADNQIIDEILSEVE